MHAGTAPWLLGALALLAGCASQRREGVPLLDARTVQVVTDEGPWKPVAAEEEIGGPWRVAHGGFERELEPVAETSEVRPPVPAAPDEAAVAAFLRPPEPSGPKLPVPRRRRQTEARPVGEKATKSPALLARDHFLDYPTHVVAERITLFVPADLAQRVQLTGERVQAFGASRRQAQGGARLVLGELTLEAERLVLRTRTDGLADLQIMARGGVQLVAEVRGNILREQDLRSLLITNDQVVPLR